jgi:hypothetical protein
MSSERRMKEIKSLGRGIRLYAAQSAGAMNVEIALPVAHPKGGI